MFYRSFVAFTVIIIVPIKNNRTTCGSSLLDKKVVFVYTHNIAIICLIVHFHMTTELEKDTKKEEKMV